MENTLETEIKIEPIVETLPIKIHKKRGPIPFPNKLTAPNKPIDPAYFNNYYKEHLSHNVTCDKCNKLVSFAKIRRHQKTKYCLATSAYIMDY